MFDIIVNKTKIMVKKTGTILVQNIFENFLLQFAKHSLIHQSDCKKRVEILRIWTQIVWVKKKKLLRTKDF